MTELNQRYLSRREAARYLSVCLQTLVTLTNKGKIPCIRPRGLKRTMYDVLDLDRFMAKGK